MTEALPHDLQANKQAVRAFCELFTAGDWAGLAELLHDDFRWIAVTSARRQSPLLEDARVLKGEPGYTKAETLQIFAATKKSSVEEKFELTPGVLTAEEDRVAATAESYAVNKANDRVYDNRYHFLMRFLDGKIVEHREYQDTLLVFDVWQAP